MRSAMGRRWAIPLVAAMLGCGSGTTPSGNGWTVLVYMVADNNLEPFALSDLEEMSRVGASSQMRFAVQIDRAVGYSSDPLPGIGDWTGTKRLLVTQDGDEELADLGEVNMGASNQLSDFVSWGMSAYPADQTALVLWDHGGAWPGFGSDDSADADILSLAELDTGLRNALPPGKKLSVLGFDACLMGTFEVAKTLAPYAQTLIASEELEPGTGWDYSKFQLLMSDPSRDGPALGQAVVDGFLAQSQAGGVGATATLAVVDLGKIASLDAAVSALAQAATAGTAADPVQLGREREASLKFGELADPSRSTHMVDLGDLAGRLGGSDARYQAAQAQVGAALAEAVLYHRAGAQVLGASGLSIYFPPSETYYQTAYDQLPAAADWRAFLKAYYAQGSATPRPTFAGGTWDFVGSSFEVTGNLTDGSAGYISEATFFYGLVDSSNPAAPIYILLGDQPADFVTLAQVKGSWNLQVLTLTQKDASGVDGVAYGYLSASVAESASVSYTIPFVYQEGPSAPETVVVRQLAFDGAGTLSSDAYYAQTATGAFGELTPVAGSTLVPLVETVDATTGETSWAPGSQTPFDAGALGERPIRLDFAQLNSGANALGLLAIQNIAGQGDTLYAVGAVP